MSKNRRKLAWLLAVLPISLGFHPASAEPVCVAVVDFPVEVTHPALAGRVGPPCDGNSIENADREDPHGTSVASVITSYSLHAHVGGIAWDYRTRVDWYDKIARCLRHFPAECALAIEWIERYLDEYAQLWSRFPIVNASIGMQLRVGNEPMGPQIKVLRWIIGQVQQSNPSLWARYTQTPTPPNERSIYLRSAGPKKLESGAQASLLDRAILVNHAELWGHTLIVTAVDTKTNDRLASYADHCGHLPGNWNPSVHGRHFCVAAPGTHEVAVSGGKIETRSGTSFATPYVAAILAEMQARCELGGSELVKRLLETADRAPPYNDPFQYGAGLVTMERALRACP